MTVLRVVAAVLAMGLTGCYGVDHFTVDPSRYDGLFFGPRADRGAAIEDDQWRIYAVFGLVAWDSDQPRWAGNRLARLLDSQRPARFWVNTKLSFLNGLAAGGLAFLTGPLQILLFVPRYTEIGADPAPGT